MFGCDVTKNIMEIEKKKAKAQEFIKEKYGWTFHMGWNIHNGVLTRVTAMFNASEVRTETVSTLESAMKEAIAKSFDTKPKVIIIQITSPMKQ